jgi:phenylalanyl-tRNA synthetase beta chain
MNVSLSWLRRYVDIQVDAATLARDLTMHGIKVERLTSSGLTERLVVVGHVLEAKPHPEADRLRVCRVDVGQPDPLEIVCGASNVATGQRVAVALVGAKLPNGVKIRKSKIRGIASNGMICSEVELGLGAESSGIMVLARRPIATFADVLGETDAFELGDAEPARPLAIGVAREKWPSTLTAPAGDGDPGRVRPTSKRRRRPGGLGFARVIHGVAVKPSPAGPRPRWNGSASTASTTSSTQPTT